MMHPLPAGSGRPEADLPALARRAQAVAPFIVMDVMNEAVALEAAGRSVIHMEVGQPAAATPLSIRRAAMAALERGHIGYTQALGLDALRERIARHYAQAHGVTVPASRVAVTTGSSAGFILTFLACFEPGARVAITAPGYPAYRNILTALGLVPVPIEVGPATRHALDGALIRRAHAQAPLAGVLVMSPANPTGVVMDAPALDDVARACRDLGLWFISDEIYHGLTYEADAVSALAVAPEAIIVNSFSKYHAMTGWRVGWLVLPERLMRPVERLQQNLSISVPYLSQVAALAAFDAREECEAVKATYAANRALLLEALPRIGFGQPLPIDGAFYAYVDVGHLTNDSRDLCRRILNEAAVALTPGLDFDEARGARTVRLSFAGATAEIAEAIDRLARWLAGRKSA
jgi:aspartate/methionine/tyrosine aminotransferase